MGNNAQRLIINHAVDSLPYDLRAFFESNRCYLVQHVNDTLNLIDNNPNERNNHFIELDKYGKFPFDALPRNYQAAIAQVRQIEDYATGLLPWQIGVYSAEAHGRFEERAAGKTPRGMRHFWPTTWQKRTTRLIQRRTLTDKMSGQSGVNERFNSVLIDRYGSFFPVSPHDASFINDPTDHAFDSCLSAHSQVESLLLADRKAKQGLSSYTDEYYDRFYNLTAASLIKQLSDASTDVGSYWLTAWINAGKPALPR